MQVVEVVLGKRTLRMQPTPVRMARAGKILGKKVLFLMEHDDRSEYVVTVIAGCCSLDEKFGADKIFKALNKAFEKGETVFPELDAKVLKMVEQYYIATGELSDDGDDFDDKDKDGPLDGKSDLPSGSPVDTE